MSEREQQPARPPLICETCFRGQIFHALDAGRRSYFCPHVAGGTWAIQHPATGEWRVIQGIDPGTYRSLQQELAGAAVIRTVAQLQLAADVQEVTDAMQTPVDPAAEAR